MGVHVNCEYLRDLANNIGVTGNVLKHFDLHAATTAKMEVIIALWCNYL